MLVVGFSLAACATAPPQGGALCSGHGLSVRADFQGGGARGCAVRAASEVEIHVAPETRPINDSAWYAFTVSANPPRTVTTTLRYDGGSHRYQPKVRDSAGAWAPLPTHAVLVAADRASARFSVSVAESPTLIAAQPVETVDAALAPWMARAAAGSVAASVAGRSRAGAPIMAFATAPPKPEGLIVLLGRQHPPERAGAVAFDAFTDRLFADDAQARAMRARFAILALPLLNPDGLAAGHWRGNGAGVDLNRDWGAFAEPETQAARQAIAHAAQSARPIALIDFHATRRSVIYAHPRDAAAHPPGFVDGWLAAWTAALGAAAPPVQRSGPGEQANAKTWAYTALGVAGLTYEAADEASWHEIGEAARRASEHMMDAALGLTRPDSEVTP